MWPVLGALRCDKARENATMEPAVGGRRAAWREQREGSYRAEQAQLVDETDLATAIKIVRLFAEHPQLGDYKKFPLGSPEHNSRLDFRNACLRWIKPGKTNEFRKESTQLARQRDQDYIDSSGIRTFRNQKKKVYDERGVEKGGRSRWGASLRD